LGFTSELMFLPDVGLGIVVLSNAQNADLFTAGIRSYIIELVFGLPADPKYFTKLQEARKHFDQTATSVRGPGRCPVFGTLSKSFAGRS
jgi:hypothetical protein